MITNSSLGQFISQFSKSNFRRNSLIADSGDVQSYIYYLESGLVKQYCVSRSGTDFMTHLFYAGSFFPPTVISGADLGSCYFEAFSPVTIRTIPLETFKNYLFSNPERLMDFATRLSRHFATLSRRINLLAGSTAYQRTAAALVYLGERLGNSVDGNGQILINQIITHKELAAWSGTARETTSIHMKVLENKGLISYTKRRIIINNWQELLHESGQ
jgi:CRP/FNR family cyclic AMP-dependent transcriptional regulator